MGLGFAGLILLIYIFALIAIYIYTVLKRKNAKDKGRFYAVADVYRREAHKEFIDKCRDKVQGGEVSYFSLDDIQNIIAELKEGR